MSFSFIDAAVVRFPDRCVLLASDSDEKASASAAGSEFRVQMIGSHSKLTSCYGTTPFPIFGVLKESAILSSFRCSSTSLRKIQPKWVERRRKSKRENRQPLAQKVMEVETGSAAI